MSAPVCPNCGSTEIVEWGTVSTSYRVVDIDGYALVESDIGLETAWDSYVYEELRCRDCDFHDADPKEFLPKPDIVLADN